MFGYATDETEECMPLTVVLAHALNKKLSELRRSGALWWARPDTKTQVRPSIHFRLTIPNFRFHLYSGHLRVCLRQRRLHPNQGPYRCRFRSA